MTRIKSKQEIKELQYPTHTYIDTYYSSPAWRRLFTAFVRYCCTGSIYLTGDTPPFKCKEDLLGDFIKSNISIRESK